MTQNTVMLSNVNTDLMSLPVEISNDTASVKPEFNSLSLIQGILHLFQNLMKNSFRLFFDAKRDYGVLAEQTQQFAQGLSQQFQSVHGTLKSTPRFKKIVGVGLKIISSYRVFMLKKEFLPEADAITKMTALHELNA